MLQLTTAGQFGTAKTYAQTKNARYTSTKSNIRSIKQRWDETYNKLPAYYQSIVDGQLEAAKSEFKRRNPNRKKFQDLLLAEAKSAIMDSVKIDGTMQRQLDIMWVLKIINQFMETLVVPIQVYRPNPTKDEFLAWDGQHTLVALWLIATHIFEEDPSTLTIPVNMYQSSLKAEMRANFIIINGREGKKPLDLIDIWEQMIFGVRVDQSKNPLWVEAEQKQQSIEKWGLFVTAKKFGDDEEAGAVTRLQEINKLDVASVAHLCQYLAMSTQLSRPVEEKEMVMMAHYFEQCRLRGIVVDAKYINKLASVAITLWDADFSPNGKFWIKASNAYHNWHNANSGTTWSGRFNKEPVHGFPFLVDQLKKSLGLPVPRNNSKSEFRPASSDLF